MSAISDIADSLAKIAVSTHRLSGRTVPLTRALDMAAQSAVVNGLNASKRTGLWESETTTEQIEGVMFYASVAADILNGSVSRPSTGNVREYALLRTLELN